MDVAGQFLSAYRIFGKWLPVDAPQRPAPIRRAGSTLLGFGVVDEVKQAPLELLKPSLNTEFSTLGQSQKRV